MAASWDQLGAVKPHVRASAEGLTALFGIPRAGGYRASAADPQGHPAGLAVDYMTGGDFQRGERLTKHLLDPQMWAQNNIKYLIWNRRYYDRPASPGTPYTGDSPHTDHVHASYKPTGAMPGIPVAGAIGGANFLPEIPNPLAGIGEALSGIAQTSAAIGAIVTKLALPSTWVRIFAGGFGIAFVFVGIMMLGREVRNG